MKTVNLNLVGIDGNVFSIMGTFRKQAKRENWNNEEIQAVLDEAMAGDYNHLLATIAGHCEPEVEEVTEEECECDECWGSGEVEYEKEVIYHGVDGREVDYEPYYETCSICDGTGYVTY